MSPRCAALLIALAVPLLAAASPEKQVVNDLRRDLAGDLRTHRSLLVNERQILLTQLGTAIQGAQSTVMTPLQCAGLISTLNEFQESVRERTDDYFSLTSSRGQGALNDFLALVPGATATPVGLTFGDGGALDASLVNYWSSVEKLYPPIQKRIATFQRACEERSGVGVTLLLRPPTPEDFPGFNFDTSFGSYANLSMDAAVGASALGASGDGLIAVVGSADINTGMVTVELNGPTAAPDEIVAPDPATGRWVAVFEGPLGEASYVVRAQQGTDAQWVSWHIGIR
jgi:hypothetical protein